jgi:hypothetical protein
VSPNPLNEDIGASVPRNEDRFLLPHEIEEYRALRATIGQRGTARVWVFLAALIAWAAATIATAALAALPVATLLPLLLLAAGFEAVFSLHTGVERIGRYLQVFYEDAEAAPSGRQWERTAMAYGRAYPGGGSDPLFALYFTVAAVLNFVPVILAEPVQTEVIVVGALHVMLVARILIARHLASGQRARDLERFQRIKQSS